MKLLKSQNVFFIGEELPMKVMAVSERYAIVTRPFDEKADEDLLQHAVEMSAYSSIEEALDAYKKEIIYAILDFESGKKAPNNLVFNPYDYCVQEDIDKCLSDLISGECELSRRNAVDIEIDFDRMPSGLELIELERNKQIYLKGYDSEWIKSHPGYYDKGQLVRAAAYTLFGGTNYIPENWPESDVISLSHKLDKEALIVAGALIAAEIDRINSLESEK